MVSEDQMAQKAAARELSLKTNSCNPSETITLPKAESQLNDMAVNPPMRNMMEDKMYDGQ